MAAGLAGVFLALSLGSSFTQDRGLALQREVQSRKVQPLPGPGSDCHVCKEQCLGSCVIYLPEEKPKHPGWEDPCVQKCDRKCEPECRGIGPSQR